MVDMPQGFATKQNIDQYTRFFEPKYPQNQKRYFESIIPLISKIIYTANIKREDMPSYLILKDAILESLSEGQIGLTRFFMVSWMTELGLTPSIDGIVIDNILSNKFEYTQRQDLYEHVEAPRRKGFLGLGGK